MIPFIFFYVFPIGIAIIFFYSAITITNSIFDDKLESKLLTIEHFVRSVNEKSISNKEMDKKVDFLNWHCAEIGWLMTYRLLIHVFMCVCLGVFILGILK